MFFRKAETVTRGTLTLLQVRIGGLHAVADVLAPAPFVHLFGEICHVCQGFASVSGGNVAELDASDVEGSRILCAWVDRRRRRAPDLYPVTSDLARAVRSTLTEGVPPEAGPTTVRVALCRGECIYVQTRKRVGSIFGAGSSRLWDVDGQRPPGRDAILIDESVKNDFRAADLKDLGGGVWEVMLGPTPAEDVPR